MPALTDRQRVEVAVPCTLVFALVTAGCFGIDPDADPVEGQAELEVKVKALRVLLERACREPIEDLTPRERGKMVRRIERVTQAAAKGWEGQPAVKIALTLYYFLRDLTEREILVLWEGSAMGEAMEMLFPMFEHGFHEAVMDASAQKQSRRLLRQLQTAGYYGGLASEFGAVASVATHV